jgi:hypothetical protein
MTTHRQRSRQRQQQQRRARWCVVTICSAALLLLLIGGLALWFELVPSTQPHSSTVITASPPSSDNSWTSTTELTTNIISPDTKAEPQSKPAPKCELHYQLRPVGIGFVERDVREHSAKVVALTDRVLSFSDVYRQFDHLYPDMTRNEDSAMFEYYGPPLVDHMLGLQQQLGTVIQSDRYRGGAQRADIEVL